MVANGEERKVGRNGSLGLAEVTIIYRVDKQKAPTARAQGTILNIL